MTSGDGMLVHQVLGGDRSSYAKLYDRYAPLIRAICHSTTRNLTDAEDLAQEVFLRAYDRLAHLKKPDIFCAWLISIARRTCLEWIRSKHRKIAPLPHDPPGNVVASNPWNEEVERLLSAVLRLPKTERLAVQSFYLLEQSAESARTGMRLSRSGFYRVLERARKRLGRILNSGNGEA
jgi:RNA polymerase sigma-70 factor (ECF subfamily)